MFSIHSLPCLSKLVGLWNESNVVLTLEIRIGHLSVDLQKCDAYELLRVG